MPYFKFQKIIFQTLKKIISNPYFNFASSKKKKKFLFSKEFIFLVLQVFFGLVNSQAPLMESLKKNFLNLQKYNKVIRRRKTNQKKNTRITITTTKTKNKINL